LSKAPWRKIDQGLCSRWDWRRPG